MFIYKIWKEGDENFYIGSTGDFHKRKRDHKGNCKNGHHLKLYTHIRANGDWCSWNMDIIEECETRDRETELIKEMKPSLNTVIYDFNRKEYMKKYGKEYREENADKMKAYHKKYSKINIDKLKENHKEYREENADKIKERKNKKYSCECGGKYTYGHRSRHFKTENHKKYLSLLSIQDDSVDRPSEKSSQA